MYSLLFTNELYLLYIEKDDESRQSIKKMGKTKRRLLEQWILIYNIHPIMKIRNKLKQIQKHDITLKCPYNEIHVTFIF